MGWVTELPKFLAPCGRRNWISHDHKHLEPLTKGGVCTQRWGKGKKWKIRILKSQFAGWEMNCVCRDIQRNIHLGYLPKQHRTDQQEAPEQWRKSWFIDWFESSCPQSCQQQGPHKRGLNWGMLRCHWEAAAHVHTLKILLKYRWSFLNLRAENRQKWNLVDIQQQLFHQSSSAGRKVRVRISFWGVPDESHWVSG